MSNDYSLFEKIQNMNEAQIMSRIAQLDEEVRVATKAEFVDRATEEKKLLLDKKQELRDMQRRQQTAKDITAGKVDYGIIETNNGLNGVNKFMSTENTESNIESRAFQKFITGGVKSMTDVEQRALAVSGTAAIMPIEVMNRLITSEKYSDLLNRATIFNEPGAASLYIPIASNTAADWKVENADVDGTSTSYEKSPTLTKLELKGYELYRWMRISAAAHALSIGNFTDMMLELLSSEVIETLEKSFISGSGSGQPKGLDNLTWTPGTNQKLTASAATAIGPAHIAEAMSFLPQKYARNAVILMNSDMLFNVSQFKGTQEYAYDMADGASRFLGKQIIVSEHMADDTIYIVDPKQLFVRFAAPIAVASDASSGFTAASIDLRALTVVDAVWNPAACVAVGLGAGGE